MLLRTVSSFFLIAPKFQVKKYRVGHDCLIRESLIKPILVIATASVARREAIQNASDINGLWIATSRHGQWSRG